MSSVVRDFSIDTTEKIREIIRENVDEEDQFFLADLYEDMFVMDELDINDYLDNVTEYHKKMLDKHNINSSKFDGILKRVYTVDINYANRLALLFDRMEAYSTEIIQLTQMISPEALVLDHDTYTKTTDNIHTNYNRAVNDPYRTGITELQKEMPSLRDIPWYEKALNTAGGFGEGLIVDSLEGTLWLPFTAMDSLFHTHSIDGLENMNKTVDQYIVKHFVTDEECYYNGKMSADAISTVYGSLLILKGSTELFTGISGMKSGGTLCFTGVGTIVGVGVEVVSLALVIEGAVEVGTGFSIAYCSQHNLDQDKTSARSAKKVQIDDIQQDEKIDKINDTIEKGKKDSEGGTKSVDDIINGLNETTNGKGVARNFESSGGYEQTLKDFEGLNPTDVKDIQTQYGTGKVGTLSDGTKVVARQGSKTGGATLEIKVSNSKVYKIRY